VERIMHLFLAEAARLGVVGGTIGFAIGIVLARWIGGRVFGVAISPRWPVFPATIALAVGVHWTGAASAAAARTRALGGKYCGENDGAFGPGRRSRKRSMPSVLSAT